MAIINIFHHHYHKFMGSGGCAVEHQTVKRGDDGSIPPAVVLKLRQFRPPSICLCLSEDTKSRWSLLSGVYAREVKDPTQEPLKTSDSNSQDVDQWLFNGRR